MSSDKQSFSCRKLTRACAVFIYSYCLCAACCAAKDEQKIWLRHCNMKEQLLVPKAATGEKLMSWPASLGYYLKADH